jgi:hypothetical protein
MDAVARVRRRQSRHRVSEGRGLFSEHDQSRGNPRRDGQVRVEAIEGRSADQFCLGTSGQLRETGDHSGRDPDVLRRRRKVVTVFDHTCEHWVQCYKNSGIERAVKDAGGKIVSGDSG